MFKITDTDSWLDGYSTAWGYLAIASGAVYVYSKFIKWIVNK